jgi:hypothetical protein
MDARSVFLAITVLSAWCASGSAQVFVGQRSIVQSANFRVYARTPEIANTMLNAAESSRKQLAIHWLGKELPNWPAPCPIIINDGPRTPASGETKYTLVRGGVANFQMSVSGTQERIIDSVLPHEITHTVMASHFAALGKPVPRWADEGACTTVEHESERSKHDVMLVRFLSEGKGIPFATLFMLKDYPRDIMPLYAQGYSVASFLISQGGPKRFIQFLERGMETEDWVAATDHFYQYPMLGKLQSAWNKWVADGGGVVDNYTADSLGVSTRAIAARTQNGNTLANNSTLGNNLDAVRTAEFVQAVGTPIQNPVRFASIDSPTLNAMNKSLNTSADSGSYYLDQFRNQQRNAIQSDPGRSNNLTVPTSRQASNSDANSIPQRVGHPAPFQTIGGGYIQR